MKFFHHLTNLPALDQTYIDEALTIKYHDRHEPNIIFAYGSFNNTGFMRSLKRHFGEEAISHYIQNPPMSWYAWHIDMIRTVSINWVIKSDGGLSGTFYRSPIPNNPSYFNLHEVDYEMYRPTLLDVKKAHCVMNKSKDIRYIMSVSLHRPIEEVLSVLGNLNISSYDEEF